MTWLNALSTFIEPSASYGNAGNVVAALCSKVLWALFGHTK
ncbi:hypothetical protein [Aquabacterium parvum]|nr:hypothetical protein [Aquabacterium parvum]